MECEHCGDDGAEWVTDPYVWEIYREEDWSWMCDRCHGIRADDI